MNMKTSAVMMRALIACAVISMAAGCAATKQARSTETSGFLGDYSKLKAGGKDRALLLYYKPGVPWSKYDKILMNPVRVYATEDSAIKKMDREELQSIVDYLDASVRTALAPNYTFVEEAGPGVLRLRIALTDAKGANIVMDTMSNVLPPAIVIGALKTAITGTSTGVGAAGVEVELQDAVTGERLAASVDRRVGTKTFEGKFDKWDDIKQSIDYWAEKLKTRLAEARAAP